MSKNDAEPTHAFSGSSWDPTAGRLVKAPYKPSIKEPLDTPYRIERALNAGRNAALGLAAIHILSAALHLARIWPEPSTLLGRHPIILTNANAVLAALALYLALLMRRKPTIWIGAAILGLALLAIVDRNVAYIYALAFPRPVLNLALVFIVIGGILGIRAVRAKRAAETRIVEGAI